MPMQRGDIYFVNLNPVQGREQAGQRPVLVLSVDAINLPPLVVTAVVGTEGETSPVTIQRMPPLARRKRFADGNGLIRLSGAFVRP
jgi:mRNA interferase MazF